MPSGGSRAGSGKKAEIPETISVVVTVKPPGFYTETQKCNVNLDAKYIQGKLVKWLKTMGVYEKVDPFLIEEYVTCVARVRQLEHVVSLMGAEDRNVSGDLYERPDSKRIDRYMKRADAARAQIYQVIRDAGVIGAIEASDSPIAQAIKGAPVWR